MKRGKVRLTDHLSIYNVQMSKIDQNFPHTLVENDSIDFLEELSNNFSFVVLDDQDLRDMATSQRAASRHSLKVKGDVLLQA